MEKKEINVNHLIFVTSPRAREPIGSSRYDYLVVVASTNEIIGLVYKSNITNKYLFKSYEKCIFNQNTLKVISDFIIDLET